MAKLKQKKLSPRAAAALIITLVSDEKRPLHIALSNYLKRVPANDQALTRELSSGVLRWYLQLAEISRSFLKRPLKAQDQVIFNLILIGLYQLFYLDMPAHASVNSAVEAARELQKPWACVLINAVLRAMIRNGKTNLQQIKLQEEATFSHPDWLLQCLQQDWPDHWQEIVAAGNERPPMTLRINTHKITRDSYYAKLQQADIAAKLTVESPVGITLQKPMDTARLPGFHESMVSVQDENAQLAAPWLDLQKKHRVLDACAAPGGKSCHMLERTTDLQLFALDHDAERLSKIKQNLTRLKLQANLLLGDATQPVKWWDGQLFDRIMLDAPCSATGVIRRNPDIKLLKDPKDPHTFAKLQLQILRSTWPLLKTGGKLLYITCSVLPIEGIKVITAFVKHQKDVLHLPLPCKIGQKLHYGLQLLPNTQGGDGFYYALLQKQAKPILDANIP